MGSSEFPDSFIRGTLAIRDFKVATPQNSCGNLDMHQFHQEKKDACVSAFVVVLLLVGRYKGVG